ncbi:winged helix DNA-binding domain-containing protein [Streptomyces sp. JH34]|uniref:winged helix DNA-binding domain-containing protein n=1 Tax=Streptomyces sp. JH34 TaxID=2793633 RepID=UPI0023FA33A5|nr:winged helix DNA-binding domain-containing protein [Streptomyces sp. JH34]MDF6020455.1 winged helix DNA-binding domain-containing protein [Streptomyces sp. JH34]
MTVLGPRALNRATLARQHLLDRTTAPVGEVVAHLCGMQAQEPQEPFTGLWSRVHAFRPVLLDRALTDRHVVRTHLMRRTIHLVTDDDALAWRARHDTMLRQRVLATYRRELAGIDLDELAAAGRTVMADHRPRTMAELVDAVRDRWPGPPRRALGELLVAALVPMAQLPPRGLWQTRSGVRNLPLTAWLGRDFTPLPKGEEGQEVHVGDDPVGQQLVRRYLAAYGPAATADIRAWSGVAGLPAAVRALRDELVTFRDERGRVLLDLPDAPRPSPDTPAPVRFLPAFDNAILGYQDRSRIIDDAHLGLSVAGLLAVLVDGRVAATWTTDDRKLLVGPLRPLTAREQEAVREEGHGLAAFLDQGIDRVDISAVRAAIG